MSYLLWKGKEKKIVYMKTRLNFSIYLQSSPAELVQVLDALLAVSNLFSTDVEPQFKSELLNRLFNALPSIHHDVSYYREMIDPTYASDKTKFFKSEAKWPDIPREKNNIKFVEGLLYDHLEELKTMTNLSNLKYVEVAGIEVNVLLHSFNLIFKTNPFLPFFFFQ